jgi:hypothetical protein
LRPEIKALERQKRAASHPHKQTSHRIADNPARWFGGHIVVVRVSSFVMRTTGLDDSENWDHRNKNNRYPYQQR